MGIVEEDDREEMGRLQEEVFGEKLSSLSAQEVSKLLQIWAVIFIGAQIVYEVSSSLYRGFVNDLFDLLSVAVFQDASALLSIYNNTHGFKYLAMVISILIGVMMTGIFLDDRFLKGVAVGTAFLFLVCFALLQIHTVSVLGRSIGIVWTSVIFHFLETAGLVCFSLYLRGKYQGV